MIETYDREHIFLKPRHSNVVSRDDVDLSVDLGKLKLKIPIIGSPMKGIINPTLVKKLAEWGGIGILHRFCTDDEFYANIQSTSGYVFGQAVGLGEMDRAEYAIESGASIICVDVANGYLQNVLNFCSEVKDYIEMSHSDALLMSGNVMDYFGAEDLYMVGVDLVRVGIGTGRLCTTRKKTKVGYGQVTALQECIHSNAKIISDGGIREPGDVVLDLAAGADAVMLGTLLAYTFESANSGVVYGMASRKNQEEYFHHVKSVEGIEETLPKEMGFDAWIDEFLYDMKSSFTYHNANNINELRANNELVVIW
jgi:IMP dehydrogenase/GMP reductase